MGGGRHLFLKYWRFLLMSLCVIGLSLGTSGLLYAQADDSDEFTLEEIIVTAEKREAELQKIPMEIDVVRPEDMLRLNVNQVYDLAKILPDVSVQSQVGSFVLVSIREVQTVQFNAMFETTVATHLNGVQLTRFGGLEGHFFDLERVEVLKGPQGTLYGRGSTAGSMNIITRKPILDEFSGNAEVEFGNYNLRRQTAAVNIPLLDNLAMRVAGINLKRDGYSDSGYQDQNSQSARMSFLWEPNDRATFTIIGDWEQYENNGYAMNVGGAPSGYYFDTYGGVRIVENTVRPSPPYTNGGPVHAPWQARWVTGDAISSDQNFNDYSSYGITAIMDYDIDFAYLTVEYGHRSLSEIKDFMWAAASLVPYPFILNAYGGADVTAAGPPPYTQVAVDPGSGPILFTATVNYGDTDSLEVRLTSKTTIPAGDPIEWIIGGYRQTDKIATETYPSVFAPNYWNLIDSKNYAVFGQASWMPIDKWNFTGGARWAWDYKDGQFIWTYPSSGFPAVVDRDHSLMFESGGLELSSTGVRVPNFSWSEPTYKINVSYIPTNDIMAYLQFSKGYRTGNVDFQGQGNPPEKLNSWELGFKSRWFGNRLQFNSGIYYYDYKNYNTWASPSRCRGQHLIDATGTHYCEDVARAPLPGEDTTIVYYEQDDVSDQYDEENQGYTSFAPGGAEQMGVSVNVIWLITMNDTVSLTGSWRHNEYGSPYNPRDALLAIYPDAISPWRDTTPDQSGREFGGSPIRANMTYSHTFYIGKDVLYTNGTLFYEGTGIDEYVNYGKPNQYVMPGRPDYYTVDVSASYSSSRWVPAGMMWNVRFSCNNVLDNDALSYISYSDDYGYGATGVDVFATGSGTIRGNYILPRTYMVTFGLNF